MRILIAEDEQDLNQLLKRRLKEAGYSADACFDGEEVFDYLLGAEYDALVLDIMMPKLDGVQVVKRLRREGNSVPVLLLTARDSIEDRVLRKPQGDKTNVLRVGELELNLSTRQAARGEQEISLSSKEFSLLRYMMQNAGIVLSRDKLEQHVWDYDFSGGSNVIDVYIRYLRKKIDEGRETKYIHTVRGHGYVLKEGGA